MSISRAPGYSVDLSDATRVASRHMREPGGVVPIDFTPNDANGQGILLWYHSCTNQLIRAIQLRQEREAPYFHQFVVLELQDNGGLFRIDRRLRPNEDTPLSCLKDEGIPAFDTIEPVASRDDPLFTASDCLISIEFKGDVNLALILKICHAIQAHSLARVYTLQRFNCYFFAQIIIICVCFGVSLYDITGGELMQKFNHDPLGKQRLTPISDKCFFIARNATVGVRTDRPMYHSINNFHPTINTPPSFKYDWRLMHTYIQNLSGQAPEHEERYPWLPPTKERHGFGSPSPSRPVPLQFEEHWKQERDLAVNGMISCVSRGVINNGIWGSVTNECIVPKGYDILEGWDAPVHPYRAWRYDDKFPPLPKVKELHPRGLAKSGSKQDLLTLIDKEYYNIQHSLGSQISEWLRVNYVSAFRQDMTIKINHMILRDKVLEECFEQLSPDLRNVPQRAEGSRTLSRWRKKSKDKGQTTTESTIIDLQRYLGCLIQAHSIRVEEYKWATKAKATDVAHDIVTTMNEIWGSMLE